MASKIGGANLQRRMKSYRSQRMNAALRHVNSVYPMTHHGDWRRRRSDIICEKIVGKETKKS